MTKIYKFLSNRIALLSLLLCAMGFVGCTEAEDSLEADYGYVQFKL